MRLNRSSLLARLYRRKPGLILLHVPKTGGSSLASAIRRHYRWSHFNVRSEASSLAAEMLRGGDSEGDAEIARQDLRASLVFYAAAQGIKFITGHVWYHPRMATLRQHGYETITLLRHPVDRWYSEYFYNRFKTGSHARIDADFEDYIESASGREAGAVYTRYFSRSSAVALDRGAVELAKRRLAELDMVGILEDLAAFEHAFMLRYGITLKMPHKRRSPARKDPTHESLMRKYKGSLEWRARVEALCRSDIELYEYARSRQDHGP
jgi:hypothetical protein